MHSLASPPPQQYGKELAAHLGLQIYVDIWPFLPSMYDHSPRCAWPHTAGEPNGPLVINFKWTDATFDQYWYDAIKNVTEELTKEAVNQNVTTSKTPQYYNLSLDETHVGKIYHDNLKELEGIRAKYDPNKVMDRTGGFRIEF